MQELEPALETPPHLQILELGPLSLEPPEMQILRVRQQQQMCAHRRVQLLGVVCLVCLVGGRAIIATTSQMSPPTPSASLPLGALLLVVCCAGRRVTTVEPRLLLAFCVVLPALRRALPDVSPPQGRHAVACAE